MFLGLHIALTSRAYQQTTIWKEASKLPGGRPTWMKLDVTSMFFAGFGLIQGYIIVASTLIAQKKSNCSKVESRDLTEVKHELASLKDIILNQNALIKERNISSLTVFRCFFVFDSCD